MAFLEIKNLFVDLKNFKLKNINLKIDKKDYVTIIGPTGSGKSILLETIAGFYKPTKGKILIEQLDISNLPPEKRCISIVYQDFALFPNMNVYENIAYGLKKKEKNSRIIKEEVEKIAEDVGITNLLNRIPNTLSGGEKQRVAIARALVTKPKILLMDEPFSALDVRTKDSLRDLIENIVKKYETTVIHVTHDLDDVFRLANKTIIMKDGEIVQNGYVNEVFSKPLNDFVANFVGANVLKGEIIGKKDGYTLIKIGRFVIRSIDNANVGSKVKVYIRPEEIILSNDLEDSIVCSVEKIKRFNNILWIKLSNDCFTLNAIVTPNITEKRISIGNKIFIKFDPSKVRILEGNGC